MEEEERTTGALFLLGLLSHLHTDVLEIDNTERDRQTDRQRHRDRQTDRGRQTD